MIPPSEFVHGAVVAVADIVEVVTKSDAATLAPWFFGPYGFVLARIRPLRTPCRKRADSAWRERRTTCDAASNVRCPPLSVPRRAHGESEQRLAGTPSG